MNSTAIKDKENELKSYNNFNHLCFNLFVATVTQFSHKVVIQPPIDPYNSNKYQYPAHEQRLTPLIKRTPPQIRQHRTASERPQGTEEKFLANHHHGVARNAAQKN